MPFASGSKISLMTANKKTFKSAVLDRLGGTLFRWAERRLQIDDVVLCEQRGARLGKVLYGIDKKHRMRTQANLTVAFPEWTSDYRHEMVKKVYEHFGIVAADFMRTPKRSTQEVIESVELLGYEHYEEANSRGKGVLLCTAHFGNWERAGHFFRAIGNELSVVAREADQGPVEKRVGDLRKAAGLHVLYRGADAREMIKRLRANQTLAILPDQNSDEVFIPFFGHAAGSAIGPAKLHIKTGAALVPGYLVRTGPGKYRAITEPVIDLNGQNDDVEALTREISLSLERVVRLYPEQYLWLHDRWKSARRRGLA